jgi:hypothetical protein
MHESEIGPSRHFRGAQLLGRFRSEADINSFEAERSMIRRVSTAVMIRVSGRQRLGNDGPSADQSDRSRAARTP